MRIYFLRHGAAEDRETWNGPDADRPLTKDGEIELRNLAKKYSMLGLSVEEIVTSPYSRSLCTARIVARGLGLAAHITIDERISPGFDIESLKSILLERSCSLALLLIGHEPDFSRVISALVGGGDIAMKKAGLARVDFDPESGNGTLVWLLPPRVLLAKG